MRQRFHKIGYVRIGLFVVIVLLVGVVYWSSRQATDLTPILDRHDIALSFEGLWMNGDTVTVKGWSASGVGLICPGKPDPMVGRSGWRNMQSGRVGDRFITQGGQSWSHWDILEIRRGMVKFHMQGGAFRLGNFDQVFWMRPYEPEQRS